MGPPPPPAAGRPRPGPGPAPAPPPAGGRRGGAEPRGQCRPGRLRPRILGTFLTSSIPEPTAPGWGAGGGHGRPRGGARGGRPLPPGRPGGRWPAWSCFCNRVFFFNFFFFFLRTRDRSRVFGGRGLSPCGSAAAPRGDPLSVPNFLFSFFAPSCFIFIDFQTYQGQSRRGARPRPVSSSSSRAGGGVLAPAPSTPGWGVPSGAEVGGPPPPPAGFSLCTRAGPLRPGCPSTRRPGPCGCR